MCEYKIDGIGVGAKLTKGPAAHLRLNLRLHEREDRLVQT